jgi:hypothetical protein
MNEIFLTNNYYEHTEHYKSFYLNQLWKILILDKKIRLTLPVNYDFEMLQVRSKTLLQRNKYKIIKRRNKKINFKDNKYSPAIFRVVNDLFKNDNKISKDFDFPLNESNDSIIKNKLFDKNYLGLTTNQDFNYIVSSNSNLPNSTNEDYKNSSIAKNFDKNQLISNKEKEPVVFPNTKKSLVENVGASYKNNNRQRNLNSRSRKKPIYLFEKLLKKYISVKRRKLINNSYSNDSKAKNFSEKKQILSKLFKLSNKEKFKDTKKKYTSSRITQKSSKSTKKKVIRTSSELLLKDKAISLNLSQNDKQIIKGVSLSSISSFKSDFTNINQIKNSKRLKKRSFKPKRKPSLKKIKVDSLSKLSKKISKNKGRKILLTNENNDGKNRKNSTDNEILAKYDLAAKKRNKNIHSVSDSSCNENFVKKFSKNNGKRIEITQRVECSDEVVTQNSTINQQSFDFENLNTTITDKNIDNLIKFMKKDNNKAKQIINDFKNEVSLISKVNEQNYKMNSNKQNKIIMINEKIESEKTKQIKQNRQVESQSDNQHYNKNHSFEKEIDQLTVTEPKQTINKINELLKKVFSLNNQDENKNNYHHKEEKENLKEFHISELSFSRPFTFSYFDLPVQHKKFQAELNRLRDNFYNFNYINKVKFKKYFSLYYFNRKTFSKNLTSIEENAILDDIFNKISKRKHFTIKSNEIKILIDHIGNVLKYANKIRPFYENYGFKSVKKCLKSIKKFDTDYLLKWFSNNTNYRKILTE